MLNNLLRPLVVQGLIGALALTVFTYYEHAAGAAFGVLIGLANVLMLAYTFDRANAKAEQNPKSGILVLYMSAVIRFMLLAVLFVIGLAFLKLEPMPMVVTFVLMQIGQMFNLQGKRRLTD